MIKNQFLLLALTLLSTTCYSQIIFEKGYYINNENQKTTCLIKNLEWKNNPTKIEYKLSESSKIKEASIQSIKEFGIANELKYVRSKVLIDRSSENISELSYKKAPIFKEETLLLKLLVEGKANLYKYEDDNLRRFFFNKESGGIKQLVYKSYNVTNTKIGKNNTFRNQLWVNLKCSTMSMSLAENLDYKKKDLVNYFIKYNECNNTEFNAFNSSEKKDLFNLNLRAGFNSSSLTIGNSRLNVKDGEFDSNLSLRIGLEAEFIMPFNKNKWSLFAGPSFQYYKSEAVYAEQKVSIDYKSIELSLGIRHYVFLNEKSKLFFNGAFLYDISNNLVVAFESRSDLEIKSLYNFGFGMGYKYGDSYSLELRYETNRDLLGKYTFWNSQYKTVAVIFGFTVF